MRAHRRRRLLLVDDDPLMRQLLTALLDVERYEVLVGADGDEAVSKTHAHHPDVVVLDVTMPGKNGIDACRELKADPSTRDVSIILLTGRSGSDDRARAEMAGADAYLVKPFSPIRLLDTIDLHFERRSRR